MAHGTIVLAVSISIAIQAIMIDAANTDTLHAGESLKAGQQLTSGGGVAKLVVQGDGNLVLYQTNTGAQNDPVLWASNTHTSTATGLHLDLQGDGNLVFYWDPGRVVWASNTSTATELVAQSDCNLPGGFLQSSGSARTRSTFHSCGLDAHACVLLCVVSTGCCGTVH